MNWVNVGIVNAYHAFLAPKMIQFIFCLSFLKKILDVDQ